MNIDEFENVCKYLDEYGVLLTDKQYSIMTDYYFNDLSLSEIGINLGISRQAVASAIKQSMAQLHEYDKKLNLINKHGAILSLLRDNKILYSSVLDILKGDN